MDFFLHCNEIIMDFFLHGNEIRERLILTRKQKKEQDESLDSNDINNMKEIINGYFINSFENFQSLNEKINDNNNKITVIETFFNKSIQKIITSCLAIYRNLNKEDVDLYAVKENLIKKLGTDATVNMLENMIIATKKEDGKAYVVQKIQNLLSFINETTN